VIDQRDRNGCGRVGLAAHAHAQRFKTLQQDPALNGEIDGPVCRIKVCTLSRMNFSDPRNHAAEAAP